MAATTGAKDLYDGAISLGFSAAGFEEKTIDVGDHTFVYVESQRDHDDDQDGKAQETVLLVHGFGADKTSWMQFASELTDDFHVVIPDLPGHGATTQNLSSDYSIPEQVRRLAEFAEKIGLSQFHVMGNSMGGGISIQLAHRFPDKVSTMVLIDSAGVDMPTPSEYIKLLETGDNPLVVRNEDDMNRLVSFAFVEPPSIPSIFRPVALKRLIARAPMNDKIFADIYSTITREDLLPQINVPTLVVWGEEDRIIDVSSARLIDKLMPNSKLVLIKNAGHVPQMEKPEEMADHFRDFLKAQKKG